METKYCVLVKTDDSCIIIAKNGAYIFNDFDTALAIKKDHENIDDRADVGVYRLEEINERGQIFHQHIRVE